MDFNAISIYVSLFITIVRISCEIEYPVIIISKIDSGQLISRVVRNLIEDTQTLNNISGIRINQNLI